MTPPTAAEVPVEPSLGRSDEAHLEPPHKPPESADDSGEWHARDSDCVATELRSSKSVGLDAAEAALRLSVHGANELEVAPGVSPWRLLLEQFENVLILILLVGAGLSAVLGHETEAVVIAVIVVFAALLGFVQEYRAERAHGGAARDGRADCHRRPRRTKRSTSRRASSSPATSSCWQPATGFRPTAAAVEAANLRVEEAALTGESVPVEKSTPPRCAGAELPIGDRTNMVYAGTTVTYGRGSVVVVATGMADRVRHDRPDARDDRAPAGRRCSRASTGSARPRRARRSPWSSSSSRSACCAASRSWRCSCSASPWRSRSCPRRCRPS